MAVKSHHNQAFWTIVVGLVGLMVLVVTMIKTHLVPVIFAFILAGTFYPLFEFFHLRKKWSRNFASFMVCLVIVCICLIPLSYLITDLVRELLEIYDQMMAGKGFVEEFKNYFFGDGLVALKLKKIFLKLRVPYTYEFFESSIIGYFRHTGLDLANRLNHILANFVTFFIDILLMLVMVFTLLIEGPKLRSFISEILKIPLDQENLILSKLNQMNFVLVIGNGLCGLIEAFFCGSIFWMMGVESVVFWATLMLFLAFIPIIGVALAYIPMGIYLMLKGEILGGFLLLIFCTIIYLVVENVFKPKFIGQRIHMNSWIIFWSILGGVSAFGMGGIFYGPIIAGLFITLSDLYQWHYQHLFKSR